MYIQIFKKINNNEDVNNENNSFELYDESNTNNILEQKVATNTNYMELYRSNKVEDGEIME